MMNRIVVTGSTSMIGVALIEECIKHGVEVLAFTRKDSQNISRLPNSNLITIVDRDLEDIDSYESNNKGYDAFYHFAWGYTDKARRMSSELQYKNVRYSMDAINLAARLGCKKFIGAGSQAEYGIHVDEKTGPDSPCTPQTPYGICKYAAGKLCSVIAKQNGMDCFWVRIFSVYGKYDQPDSMISSTIAKLRAGEHCSFTPATHKWDYLYSEDAGRAFYLIGEKARGNKMYCLGKGESKPLFEYIYTLKNFISKKSSIGIGEIQYSDGVPVGFCADTTQINQDTGWVAEYEFIDGIKKLLANDK